MIGSKKKKDSSWERRQLGPKLYISVAPRMNLITHTKTKSSKIKLKLLERSFDSCFSTPCSIYKKFQHVWIVPN